MLKKFLFGIALIACVAIATINVGISSKKNSMVDLKNANTEALASTEGVPAGYIQCLVGNPAPDGFYLFTYYCGTCMLCNFNYFWGDGYCRIW